MNGRPRCLECYRKAVSKWHKNNPEKSNAQARLYDHRFRVERKEAYNAKRRRFRKPSTMQASYKRRAEWLGAGDVTREQLIEISRRDNGQCICCGAPVRARFTPSDPRGFDHIVPRVQGGKHTASNLVVYCRKCNSQKAIERDILVRCARVDIVALNSKWDGRCHWCCIECRGEEQLDHKIPISRGGSNSISNLCFVCKVCNIIKGASLPLDYVCRLLRTS